MKRCLTIAIALSSLLAGCASTPEEQARINEALRGLSNTMRENADYMERNQPRTIYCNTQAYGYRQYSTTCR